MNAICCGALPGGAGCRGWSVPRLSQSTRVLAGALQLFVSAAGLWLSALPEAGSRSLRGLGQDVSFVLVYLVLNKGAECM